MSDDRQVGTVAGVLYNYGFIVPKDGGGEIFFHGTAVRGGRTSFRALAPGDEVSYRVIETSKGPRAVAVEAVLERVEHG